MLPLPKVRLATASSSWVSTLQAKVRRRATVPRKFSDGEMRFTVKSTSTTSFAIVQSPPTPLEGGICTVPSSQSSKRTGVLVSEDSPSRAHTPFTALLAFSAIQVLYCCWFSTGGSECNVYRHDGEIADADGQADRRWVSR